MKGARFVFGMFMAAVMALAIPAAIAGPAGKSVPPATQTMEFKGETVKAQAETPAGTTIVVPLRPLSKSLIRPRLSFFDRIVTSAEDL